MTFLLDDQRTPVSAAGRALHSTPTSPAREPDVRIVTRVVALARTARPHQWIKNVAVLMVPGLAILTIGTAGVIAALGAVLAFCLAASSVYLVNDIADRKHDRLHPTKKFRPIASGLISPTLAMAASAVMASAALVVASMVTPGVAVVVAVYLATTAAYSLVLKRFAFIDVALVAAGFVLRVLAGAIAVSVAAPPLLLFAVFCGAVFLSLGKRRSESLLLGGSAPAHRSALRSYTAPVLGVALVASQAVTVAAFAGWVFMSATGPSNTALGLLAGSGLAAALNGYRSRISTGSGGDPTHDLTSNATVLAALMVTGVIAMWAGMIR